MIRRTLVIVFFLGLLSAGAQAQVPSVLHYQASLLEDNEQVEGDVEFTARIFDTETGGQALWSENRPEVSLDDGRISLLLGSMTSFPDGLFDGEARYLEIEINGERLPRMRMASTAYALRSGVAAAVVAGAVDSEALAEGAAVTSINDVPGSLTIEGSNGATVNVDSETKTITISAPGGTDESSGITGVQNNDGALEITNPNGPTATINVQPGGIGTAQLGDGEVGTADLDGGAVTAQKLADGSVTGAKLASGAAVNGIRVGSSTLTGTVSLVAGEGTSLAVDEETIRIAAEGAEGTISGVTAGTGLTGGGTEGDVTLGLADGGVGTAQLTDGAVNSAKIADGTITSTDLADDAAVNSVNGLQGELQLAADGGASVNVDQETGVITLSAPEADGEGILGIQNSDGALSITDPNGPTATINLQDGGIGVDQLASGSVTTAKLAENSVTSAIVENNSLTGEDLAANSVGTSELNTTSGPESGQVLGYDGTALEWTAVGGGDITSVVAAGGLSGGATSGEATLSIADGGVTGGRIATGAIVGGENVTVSRDTDRNVVIGSPSVLTSAVESISADGSTLDGALDFAATGDATLSVSGNTITFGATGGGGSSSVSTDATLTGNGTNGNPLGVATGAISEAFLDVTNDPSEGQVLSSDGSATFTWVDPSSTVTTDGTTLTGDGSSGSPLSISDGGVGSDQIADGGITEDDLDTGAVTSTIVADNSLTADDLGTGAVTADELATDAVTPDAIAADAVTSEAIADESVGAGEVNDGSLGAIEFTASGGEDGNVLSYDEGASGNLSWREAGEIESSLRYKSNVETITGARALVEQLRGVRFQWKDDGQSDVGLIAEEVAQVFPELVTYEADGTTIRGLRYAPLVGVLIEAAKAQQSALDASTERIATQEREIEALRDRLRRLEDVVESMQPADARP